MDDYELDERKTKILNAIIRTYLETGEPAQLVIHGRHDPSAMRWQTWKSWGTSCSLTLPPAGSRRTEGTASMWTI